MPILIMAVMALALFIGIGLLLFGATFAETRERKHEQAQADEANPPARGAHA